MNLIQYKKEVSELDIILKYIYAKNKTIIDAGCGSGYLTNLLAESGARVYGIDKRSVIAKAKENQNKNAFFRTGKSEKLPFRKNFADVIIYYASFHHIPKEKMPAAISECKRVLKPGGFVIFVEPSLEKGCYFELLKIVLDERKIQKYIYGIIKKLERYDFKQISEKHFFLKRTFNDFLNAVNQFIYTKKERESAILKAEIKLLNTLKKSKKEYNNLFKSTARINVFKFL